MKIVKYETLLTSFSKDLSLLEFQTKLAQIKDTVPRDFWSSIRLYLEVEESGMYGDACYSRLVFKYEVPETPEEAAARLKSEASSADRQKTKEMEQYYALKRKYNL